VELFRTLGVLAEPPGEEHAALAELLELPTIPSAEEYTEWFLLQLYPYASVYVGDEGMMGGEARARVGGFWSALGYSPPSEPDHLSALFGLYATLKEAELREADPARRTMYGHGRGALLWEHLASWIMPYLDRMEALASPAYAAWAGIARTALLEELRRIDPPDGLPRHLRESHALDLTAPGRGEDPVSGLLTPVRSGIILTRADLARGAGDLGTGLRIGERAFVLRAFFSQDPEGTAAWLAREAESWTRRHEAMSDALGPVAEFWADRAKRTTIMLQTEVLCHAGH
jgi:TorA maturation chaperone TorD